MNIVLSPIPNVPAAPAPRAPEGAEPAQGAPDFAQALQAADGRQGAQADEALRRDAGETDDAQAAQDGGLLVALLPDAAALNLPVAATPGAAVDAGQGVAAGPVPVAAEGEASPAVAVPGAAAVSAALPAGESAAAGLAGAGPATSRGAIGERIVPSAEPESTAGSAAAPRARGAAAATLARRLAAENSEGRDATEALAGKFPATPEIVAGGEHPASAFRDAAAPASAYAAGENPSAGASAVSAAAARSEAREAAPATVARDVGSPGWAQDVGDRLSQFVALRADRAQIRLHPESLGPIHIRIAWQDDNATMLITAAQPVTREALEQALPQLREALAGQGVSLGEVSVRDGQAGGEAYGGEARGGAGGGTRGHPGDEAARVIPIAESGPSGRAPRLVDTFA